jgi:hypothetical protein
MLPAPPTGLWLAQADPASPSLPPAEFFLALFSHFCLDATIAPTVYIALEATSEMLRKLKDSVIVCLSKKPPVFQPQVASLIWIRYPKTSSPFSAGVSRSRS